MGHQAPRRDSPPPSGQHLAQLVSFEYRSPVMRRLDVTAEWRGQEWTTDAMCAHEDGAADSVPDFVDFISHVPAAAAANDVAEFIGYRLCAERFTVVARHLCHQIPALTADVQIEADANTNNSWCSGTTVTDRRGVDDPLVQQLWHAARDATPLPNVDIWHRAASEAKLSWS